MFLLETLGKNLCPCLFLLLEAAHIPCFVALLHGWPGLSHLITWTLTLLPTLVILQCPCGLSRTISLFQSQLIYNLNSICNLNSPVFSFAMCISQGSPQKQMCMYVYIQDMYIYRKRFILRNWLMWLWSWDSTKSEEWTIWLETQGRVDAAVQVGRQNFLLGELSLLFHSGLQLIG